MKKSTYHMPTGEEVHRVREVIRDLLAQLRGKRILDARRRRTAQLVLLGLAITVATLGLDLLGGLRGMENWFYDQRCYYFQFRFPSPSPAILHLDIDDGVLQATQKWPWPRSLQARVIRELSLAGPKVIFLDIVYEESDQDPAQDAALAEAIGKAGNVIAPVTLGLKIAEPTPEVQFHIATYLKQPGRLGDTLEEVRKHLRPADLKVLDNLTIARLQTVFFTARAEAARAEVREVLDKMPNATLEEVYKSLGMSLTYQTAITVEVAQQWALLSRERAVGRFGLVVQPSLMADMAVPFKVDPPVVDITRAAAWSGFVDFIPSYAGDSKVRFVPMVINLDGKALPHVALVMACAYLGTDISSVVFQPNRIIIPNHAGGRDIEIPTRTLRRERDQNASYVADIPWFGGREWETMYDVPEHKVNKQHYSLTVVTNVMETEHNIDVNVKEVKRLVGQVVSPFDADIAKALIDMDVNADNLGDFRAFVGSALKDTLDSKQKELDAEMGKSDDRKLLLANIGGLKEKLAQYEPLFDGLLKLREQQRKELHELLGGKIVLVGFTATGAMDQYSTALHNSAPGVVAHGALVNGILTDHFWRRASDYYTYLLTLSLGTLVTMFVAVGSPWKATFGALSSIFIYLGINGLLLFDWAHIVVGVAGPMTAMSLAWAVVTLFRFLAEIQDRNRITARFRTYVDPALVNYYVQNPDEQAFAGRAKEMTAVFTDLEGFTTLSEKVGAGIVAVLNDYVARMVPIIREHGGFIDKFLGDGIMFEYNAIAPNPNHAADAITTVIQMQHAMKDINKSLTARDLPNLRMRVGVNTGSMIVGDAGGAGATNFTILGDNVNLTARLESANKYFGSLMMISEATLIAAGRQKYSVRPLARIQVKGKEQAVMVYEPLCLVGELTPECLKIIDLSTAVFEKFIAADFEGCMKACDRMDAELGESKFTKLYHKESMTLLAEGAGPDFDGRITMSEK